MYCIDRPVNLHVRLWKNGEEHEPDDEGFIGIEDLHMKMYAKHSDLVFFNLESGEQLLNVAEKNLLIEEKDREIEKLKAELRKLKGE